MVHNTTGRITAVGRHAVKSNTTGVQKTLPLDMQSLRDTTTGANNTAVGGDALLSKYYWLVTTCAAVGAISLYANTTASYNTTL